MTTSTSISSPLEHELQPHFEGLARFESTAECEASELYRSLRSRIETVLTSVEQGVHPPRTRNTKARLIRAAAWNIERGIQLDRIIQVLGDDPVLREADVLYLTEVDYGMARAGNRHVGREIADALGFSYAFAPCYLALNKGSGVEADAEGENTLALHGNALFSRYPIQNAHALALPNGKDKMVGREKRLGSQRATIADIEHPAGTFRAVVLHMDAHSAQAHRHRQMKIVMDHVDTLKPPLPTLIGGDWNTTTHNASRALYSILGFVGRVLMGVRRALAQHYPYPDRWFERHMFRDLERRGFEYKSLNVPGGCTLHYSIKDIAANKNMGEWIPQWCFWFLNWALEPQGGRCSLKLDWFAGRGIQASGEEGPAVLEGLSGDGPPLSDHDPIVLGFTLAESGVGDVNEVKAVKER
jgi:endonuclease/exonuclease/phosphatase family metal-dependent hydrolase